MGYAPSDGEQFVGDQNKNPSVEDAGDHNVNHDDGVNHVVVGHVRHDGGGQSSRNQGYGPVRQTSLTQAMS